MNIDKWIEENSTAIEDRGTCSVSYFIDEDKFRELLKTHAIVPRDIESKENVNIVLSVISELSISCLEPMVEVENAYKAMIKAAEGE